MRRFERIRDLLGNLEGFVNRQRAAGNSIRKALPIDRFKDNKLLPVRFLQTIDRSDVRVVQGGEELDFAWLSQVWTVPSAGRVYSFHEKA